MTPHLLAAIALAALAVTGCATSLAERARRAAEGGADPEPLVAALRQAHAEVDATKRIFGVTLIEGRRRFGGEGAMVYTADPRRLRADVFGPHDTPVLHVRLKDDSLTVVLPREGETLSGVLGDPRFAELTGERALVSPEILGAMLGVYDVERLLTRADAVAAEVEGGRRTLLLREGDAVHALALEDGRLVEYRQERAGRDVYRVRFERFEPVNGRASPRYVVLRDYVRGRQLVLDVRSERTPDPSDLDRLARSR
ncbi:MAG TPA: hypothetical protein VM778_01060 [Gemmatimonadota bacterium]|nr:hypothetical protein [Gemmatimonadota bacterium]